MSENTIFLFIVIVAFAAVAYVFWSTVVKGKSSGMSGDVEATLAEINEGVQELRGKVAEIEKMLREVE